MTISFKFRPWEDDDLVYFTGQEVIDRHETLGDYFHKLPGSEFHTEKNEKVWEEYEECGAFIWGAEEAKVPGWPNVIILADGVGPHHFYNIRCHSVAAAGKNIPDLTVWPNMFIDWDEAEKAIREDYIEIRTPFDCRFYVVPERYEWPLAGREMAYTQEDFDRWDQQEKDEKDAIAARKAHLATLPPGSYITGDVQPPMSDDEFKDLVTP